MTTPFQININIEKLIIENFGIQGVVSELLELVDVAVGSSKAKPATHVASAAADEILIAIMNVQSKIVKTPQDRAVLRAIKWYNEGATFKGKRTPSYKDVSLADISWAYIECVNYERRHRRKHVVWEGDPTGLAVVPVYLLGERYGLMLFVAYLRRAYAGWKDFTIDEMLGHVATENEGWNSGLVAGFKGSPHSTNGFLASRAAYRVLSDLGLHIPDLDELEYLAVQYDFALGSAAHANADREKRTKMVLAGAEKFRLSLKASQRAMRKALGKIQRSRSIHAIRNHTVDALNEQLYQDSLVDIAAINLDRVIDVN